MPTITSVTSSVRTINCRAVNPDSPATWGIVFIISSYYLFTGQNKGRLTG